MTLKFSVCLFYCKANCGFVSSLWSLSFYIALHTGLRCLLIAVLVHSSFTCFVFGWLQDEERLRIIYEKKCRKLRALDGRGAEASKIDATRASIRKLLTKINICIRAVDCMSGRIHKLRDEELQPQLTELIHGYGIWIPSPFCLVYIYFHGLWAFTAWSLTGDYWFSHNAYCLWFNASFLLANKKKELLFFVDLN